MKVFEERDLHAALAYAQTDIAIHLHDIVFPKSPKCFRDAVAKGQKIAHVFSQNATQLEYLAKSCGVSRIVIEKGGTPRQHVDMCGKPLERLLCYLKNSEQPTKKRSD